MTTKLERHLNFIQVLLSQRGPVTKEFLRQQVGGYRPANGDPKVDEAFEKMFDRDKRELIAQGVPLDTRRTDPLSDVMDGYVIDKVKFFLPTIQLTERQQKLLQRASNAWFDDTLRKSATRATHNVIRDDTENFLSDIDAQVTLAFNPRGVSELLEAIATGQRVKFDYVSSSSTEVQSREVDPWQLFVYGGHWYVVGYDVAKSDGYRIFKLSRIKSDITIMNKTIEYEEPEDFVIQDVVGQWRLTSGGAQSAHIKVAKGECGALRKCALTIHSDDANDVDVLEIPYGSEVVLANVIAEVADFVTVVAPESLIHAVNRVLNSSFEVHSDES